MKLIIGLGNPEDKYKNTRHNLGFEVLNHFVKDSEFIKEWQLNSKFKSEIVVGKDVILVKPQTYMNNSGESVSTIAHFYKVEPEDILVVHDELDLPLGQTKVKIGGSSGGHNGVQSVIDKLGTDQFIRIRLGIGNHDSHEGEHQRSSFNAEKFVIEKFENSETHQVKTMTEKAIKILNTILKEGLESAQNQYN